MPADRNTAVQPGSSQPKLKQSRTSTQKVRTGCMTCKRRHIKCDEGKPQCVNCLRAQRRCEGYIALPGKKIGGLVELCWDSRQAVDGAAPKLQLQVDPDAIDFRNATSLLYFQEFVSLVRGPWIKASSSDDLWEVTLPQLARNDIILRPAAVAIGALSIWHRQSRYESLRAVSVPDGRAAEEDTHYFQAVAHYCQSLRLQSQRGSPANAVLLSVLLLFFERLRGNKQAALDHVNHGLTLLFALLTEGSSCHHMANLASDPSPLLRAVADVFTHLALQVRTILRGRIGLCTPVPNLRKGLRKKKHTMESFMTRMSQLPRPPTILSQTPSSFSSLDEFEEHWVNKRRHQTAVVSAVSQLIQASSLQSSRNEDVMNCFHSALSTSSRLKELSKESMKEMQAIDASFLPLFNSIIMADAESPAYMRAIHLRLQYLAVYVIDDPIQYLDVDTLNSRTSSFREYTSLAELALRTAKRTISNPAYQLSLECELARYLVIVAFFCRDTSTRDHAVCLLGDYPGQEGLWNTRSLYAVALRNREVERENASEGTSAEQWQRLWRREFIFEDCGDRVVFRYLEKDQPAGEWQLVEEVADVGAVSEEASWIRRPITGSGGILIADLYSP